MKINARQNYIVVGTVKERKSIKRAVEDLFIEETGTWIILKLIYSYKMDEIVFLWMTWMSWLSIFLMSTPEWAWTSECIVTLSGPSKYLKKPLWRVPYPDIGDPSQVWSNFIVLTSVNQYYQLKKFMTTLVIYMYSIFYLYGALYIILPLISIFSLISKKSQSNQYKSFLFFYENTFCMNIFNKA